MENKERIRLNIGPVHPAMHGVLKLILDVERDTIVKAQTEIGFLHRASEKIAEVRYFKEAGFHTNARSEAPAIDFNKCIFCGLCSEICPPKVLHHTHKYDISTDKRKDLIHDPFKLKETYESLVKPYEEQYDIIKFQKAGTPQQTTTANQNSQQPIPFDKNTKNNKNRD